MEIGAIIRIKDGSPDNAEWYGRVGKYVRFNENCIDGDFYGVQFPESMDVTYFWKHELEILGTFSSIFSIQPYSHREYHTWAIAVGAEIIMDVWENSDAECPFFWGKHDELQEMIDRKDSQLLKLLTPSGIAELHKVRYDRIMAQS
jgi:hypothetical protein